MSMIYCHTCAWLIDSDDDPECFGATGFDRPTCDRCREEFDEDDSADAQR